MSTSITGFVDPDTGIVVLLCSGCGPIGVSINTGIARMVGSTHLTEHGCTHQTFRSNP